MENSHYVNYRSRDLHNPYPNPKVRDPPLGNAVKGSLIMTLSPEAGSWSVVLRTRQEINTATLHHVKFSSVENKHEHFRY